MNELKEISEKYLNGQLCENTDEAFANGYWDLAGEMVDFLQIDDNDKIVGYTGEQLREELQTGFYQVLQKVLVRGENFE